MTRRLDAALAALELRDDGAPPDIENDALLRENDQRERALWTVDGVDLLPWKRALQRMGWVVFYCTERGRYAGKQTGFMMVGNRVIPVAELRAMAEREERLAKEGA